uniref:O-6-methylguanine-DNA methyltransferase n=1 Tax=Sus scrofa TaxID=9823 RepID=A0A4X1V935_PIG
MPGLPAFPQFASVRLRFLAVGGSGTLVLGSMGKTCEMGRAVVDSPLGKIEISGCEQGLHEIRLCGRKTLDPDPAEAPAPPKQLAGPEEMMEPLGQCAAWLDAYFRKPAVLQELPVPALHHPLFQQGAHPRPVPQSGPQQRRHRQLLGRNGRQGVASGPRGSPGRETGLWRGLASGRSLAPGPARRQHPLPGSRARLSVRRRSDDLGVRACQGGAEVLGPH